MCVMIGTYIRQASQACVRVSEALSFVSENAMSYIYIYVCMYICTYMYIYICVCVYV